MSWTGSRPACIWLARASWTTAGLQGTRRRSGPAGCSAPAPWPVRSPGSAPPPPRPRGGGARARAAEAGIRVVQVRSGLVLTPGGGLLARLLPLAKLGLCPRFASGRQAMSWISLSDEIAAIRFVLDRKDISGPVNLTAPNPATNSELTTELTAAVGRHDLRWLRIPAPVLRLALGEAAVELLSSARIIPKRLLDAGYEFRHPTLPDALSAELASGADA